METTCPQCDRPYGKRRRCYYCQPGRKRTGGTKSCEYCGEQIHQAAWEARASQKRFCSYECKYAANRGVEQVYGTRYVRRDGYVAIKIGIRQYELEHRIIAEQMLGRALKPDEQVHHKNGKKADNRPENLEVLTNAEHQKLHNHVQTRSRRIVKTCERCGTQYEKKRGRAAESKYCGNSCRVPAMRDAKAAKRKKE